MPPHAAIYRSRIDVVGQHAGTLSIGTAAGHSVLEPKSNVLIVTDTPEALESLRGLIDAETLEAMGVPAAKGRAPGGELRPPSLGATTKGTRASACRCTRASS